MQKEPGVELDFQSAVRAVSGACSWT